MGNSKINTMLKARIKKIWIFLNSLLSIAVPVVDYRKKSGILLSQTNRLTEQLTIEGLHPDYRIVTGEKPYWLSVFSKGINFPGVFSIKIKNGCLVGRGIIINNKKKVILESAIFQKEYLNKLLINHLLIKTLLFKPRKQLNNVIPLLNRLSNNYYHWTTESLPRLAIMIETGKEDLSKYKIVIAKDAPSFIKDSLTKLLRWPEERIITWENNETAKVKNCLLISFPFVRNEETQMTNIYSPSVYSSLHNFSLRNIPCSKHYPENIIVSRKKSSNRRIVNEEILQSAFPGYSFTIVCIETMPFVEQVQIFRNAKVIITPHGAGLVNLVYTNNNPLVIEVFPSTRKIRDAALFYQITAEKNIDYRLIVKDPINNNQDVVADENLLKQIGEILYYDKVLCA